MTGCLKSIFAYIGCGTVLLIGAVLGWQYRSDIAGLYRTKVSGTTTISDSIVTNGVASRGTYESARTKEKRFDSGKGPDAVILSPAEMASLIRSALPAEVRKALDSVTVTLEPGRIVLGADIITTIFGKEALGRFRALLRDRERIRLGGGAEYLGDGILRWKPDQLSIRSIPFPQAMVARLVNRLTARSDGSLLLPVPGVVEDIRIRPDGVIFYREIRR